MIINHHLLFRTINKASDELKNETLKYIENRDEEEKTDMDPSREELREIKEETEHRVDRRTTNSWKT